MQYFLQSMFLESDVNCGYKSKNGSRIKGLILYVVHGSPYFFTDRIGYGSRFHGHGWTRIKKNLDPHASTQQPQQSSNISLPLARDYSPCKGGQLLFLLLLMLFEKKNLCKFSFVVRREIFEWCNQLNTS